MSVVRPSGRLMSLHGDGALRNEADASALPSSLQPAVEAVVGIYRAQLGHRLRGVYLRGSAVRGTFVPGVSDLDTWALCDGDDEGRRIVVDPYRGEHEVLTTRFGLDIELCHTTWARLQRDDARFARMLLATQAVCVFGRDDLPALGRFFPGVDTMGHCYHVAESVDELLGASLEPGDEVAHAAVWIAKALVRAGLEVTAERHGQYSRDLWPCYCLFAAFHPDRAEAMHRALEVAVAPPDDPSVLRAALVRFRDELVPVVSRPRPVGASG